MPLTVKQIHSMQSLQTHAPEMKELQKKYKGDRAKLNEEMMKFYRENNINPAASCLPLLAQLPVFFSLYFVLKHFSKHIPPGSDLSWLHIVPNITDKATSHWSGYLLLAIYAVSQVPRPGSCRRRWRRRSGNMMMVLPLIFIGVIAHFPTGLVLYWVTTNLWTVGQGIVTRRLVPRTPVALPTLAARNGRRGLPPKGAAAGQGRAGNGARTEPPARSPPARPDAAAPVKRKKGGARR